VIRESLAAIARNPSMGGLINRTPVARSVVARVVGGDSLAEAIAVADELANRGMWVALERAARPARGDDEADVLLADYLELARALHESGLDAASEIAVFADWLDPNAASSRRLTTLVEAASALGIAVTVGMGPASSVDRALAATCELQQRGLLVGATLQANLLRAEDDCRRLADQRVRLVKGGYRESAAVAHRQPAEIDKAFVRCAKILLKGRGEPSFATHDPRLIEIIEDVAQRYGRAVQTYEFAFYMGRMQAEQTRLCDGGHRVRIYVPYGPDWFARLVGGLAEQPASITSAVRSLLPGLPTRSTSDDQRKEP
jgi:proline dehydrogenase